MSDLISREAAIEAIEELISARREWLSDTRDEIKGLDAAICEIQNLPAAEKVKRGRWVKLDMHPHLADHKCTACGESAYVPTCMGEPMYLFCPNCGARMEGEEDERPNQT